MLLSLLLSLLCCLLLSLLLGLLLGLLLALLSLLAIHVDDDRWWGSRPEDQSCELGLRDGLLVSQQLRLQVEERTRSDELAVLLDEVCVTNEQALVRQNDGGWVSEDLGVARSLWWLRAKGQQDSAIDLTKGRVGVELGNLRGCCTRCLRSVARASNTGDIQVWRRRGRADRHIISRVDHHKDLLAWLVVIRLELVDHVASVDVFRISLINDIGDRDDDSVDLGPSCSKLRG